MRSTAQRLTAKEGLKEHSNMTQQRFTRQLVLNLALSLGVAQFLYIVFYSISSGREDMMMLKYARVLGSLAGALLLGVVLKRMEYSSVTISLLAFCAYRLAYGALATEGEVLRLGFMFLFVLFGIGLIASQKDMKGVDQVLKYSCAIFAAYMLVNILANVNNADYFVMGRLSPEKNCANVVAMNLAYINVAIVAYALMSHAAVARLATLAFATVFGGIVLLTGSRTGTTLLLISTLIHVIGNTRRLLSARTLLTITTLTVTVLVLTQMTGKVDLGQSRALKRTVDTSEATGFNSRFARGAEFIEKNFSNSRFFGVGMLPPIEAVSSHNSYLMILVEQGLLGLIAFLILITWALHRTATLCLRCRKGEHHQRALLAMNLLVCTLVAGIPGVTLVTATDSTAFFLGVSLGLTDRLFAEQEDRRAHRVLVIRPRKEANARYGSQTAKPASQ